MTPQSIALLVFFFGVLLVTVKPMGLYLAAVAEGRIRWGWVARSERALLLLCGVHGEEMSWRHYAIAVLLFNTLGFITVYALQRLQQWLPLNPQDFGAVSPDSAFNTAVSFVTNTNWQGYAGESTMSYLTQMLGLAVQNFFAAATGMAVVFALIRGFARHSAKTVGNFWIDLYRTTIYVLLPLSFVFALVLVSQGVIQNFKPYVEATMLEPTTFDAPVLDADSQPVKDEKGNPRTETKTTATQLLPMGPIASQEAIKQLGTNGGGFLNANSAHPYENPSALTNFLQMLAIFLIPAGLCYAFGRMVGDTRQGWAVFAAMSVIFIAAAGAALVFEQQGNPAIAALGVDDAASKMQSGGNMEGKETRFGIAASGLFAAITTAASCGAVNAMHDSFTPLGGLVPMWLMQLGEVVFGGVGSGLYGMLVFALTAVFIAGLMIGRTPEYLGKRIESYEIKMISIVILVTPVLVLTGTAISLLLAAGEAGIQDPGAHGLSEVLYAFSSAANNNGSAFAGLSANTPYYNLMLGIAMWLGRFAAIVPALALAGSLAAKKKIPVTAGTMPTSGALFVALLVGTVLLIGALTYLPALALGPVVEHLILTGTK